MCEIELELTLELDRKLKEEAARRGMSEEELICEMLEKELGERAEER